MDDRSTNAPSPRRGQYGDTAQRCAWCGIETTYAQRAIAGGSFRRNYCSYSCSAAGDLYVSLFGALVLPIVIFFLIFVAPTQPNTYVAPPEIILILLGIPELILLGWVWLGHSQRRSSQSLQDELRR